MPRNFYILRDDQNHWFFSESGDASGAEKTCRTRQEALDHLRNFLSGKGLIMGPMHNHHNGFRVEAMEGPEVAVGASGPMLYDADSLNTVDFIKGRLGRMLQQAALDMARRDGRTLVTGDDVFEALDRLGLSKIYPASGEGAGNGG